MKTKLLIKLIVLCYLYKNVIDASALSSLTFYTSDKSNFSAYYANHAVETINRLKNKNLHSILIK